MGKLCTCDCEVEGAEFDVRGIVNTSLDGFEGSNGRYVGMGIGTTKEFAIDREPGKLRIEATSKVEELMDLLFQALQDPLILKKVVIWCEQVFTVGT